MSGGNGNSVTLDLPTTSTTEETDVESVAPDSTLAHLRRRREELRAERETLMELPGYNGLLAVRYKPVPYQQLQQINAEVDRQTRKSNPYAVLNGQRDTLIEACIEIVSRPKPTDAWRPLVADQTYQFSTELADLFGFEAETARKAVSGLFPSEIAIGNHYQDYIQWLEGADADADEELQGE